MRRSVVFAALFGCFLVGYQGLILGLFLVRAGAWPNFFSAHNFIVEGVEYLSYRPPWRELLTIFPDQPVYTYGWIFEKTNTTQWLFIFTLRNLATSVLLSLLLAANVMLIRNLKAGQGALKGSACMGGMAGVMGAGVSAAACCGTSSSSILLATLGLGSSAITLIELLVTPLEWLGVILLIGSTAYLYRAGRASAAHSRARPTLF